MVRPGLQGGMRALHTNPPGGALPDGLAWGLGVGGRTTAILRAATGGRSNNVRCIWELGKLGLISSSTAFLLEFSLCLSFLICHMMIIRVESIVSVVPGAWLVFSNCYLVVL